MLTAHTTIIITSAVTTTVTLSCSFEKDARRQRNTRHISGVKTGLHVCQLITNTNTQNDMTLDLNYPAVMIRVSIITIAVATSFPDS